MKQMISKQMDGSLITQQFAVNLSLTKAVQTTLYDYIEGLPVGKIFEVDKN